LLYKPLKPAGEENQATQSERNPTNDVKEADTSNPESDQTVVLRDASEELKAEGEEANAAFAADIIAEDPQSSSSPATTGPEAEPAAEQHDGNVENTVRAVQPTKSALKASGRRKRVPPPAHRKTMTLERKKNSLTEVGSDAAATHGWQRRQASARLANIGERMAAAEHAEGLLGATAPGEETRVQPEADAKMASPRHGSDDTADYGAAEQHANANAAGGTGVPQQGSSRDAQAGAKPKRKSLGLREVLGLSMSTANNNAPLFPVTWGGSTETILSTRSRSQASGRPFAQSHKASEAQDNGAGMGSHASGSQQDAECVSMEVAKDASGPPAAHSGKSKTRQPAAVQSLDKVCSL
jgi:hypothetical protein